MLHQETSHSVERNSIDNDNTVTFVEGMGSLTIVNRRVKINEGVEFAARPNDSSKKSRHGGDNTSSKRERPP